MNKKEITYNTALDIVFMNRCHNCGCTPKNDEWSNRAKNLCIDCKLMRNKMKEKWKEIKEMYPPALWFANIGLVIIALLVILFV